MKMEDVYKGNLTVKRSYLPVNSTSKFLLAKFQMLDTIIQNKTKRKGKKKGGMTNRRGKQEKDRKMMIQI